MSVARADHLPFEVHAEARLCRCKLPVEPRGRHKHLKAATLEASGIWELILAFYGETPYTITVYVVDVRDGTIMWRDGRAQREDHSGKLIEPEVQQPAPDPTAGGRPRPERRPGRRGPRPGSSADPSSDWRSRFGNAGR